MVVSVRLNDRDYELFKSYADEKGLTMSELLRETVRDRIEKDLGIETTPPKKKHERVSIAQRLEEVIKELNLDGKIGSR